MLSRVRPALLTRMSIGPRACSAAADRGVDLIAPSATSQADADRAVAQLGGHRAAPAPAPGRRRRPWRPRRAGRRAMARPMPRVLPVTKAVLPVRSMVVMPCTCEELLHLVGGPERHGRGAGHDPLEQPGQHVARADLDERRAGRERGGGLHAGHPAHRRRELVDQEALGVDAGAHRPRRSRWR